RGDRREPATDSLPDYIRIVELLETLRLRLDVPTQQRGDRREPATDSLPDYIRIVELLETLRLRLDVPT
ncbi:hypothetical protein CTI14_72260, partial [Methylobacterium radiotolerans]